MVQRVSRQRWFSKFTRRKDHKQRPLRLYFEPLEDRRMLALLGIQVGPFNPPDISFASCNGSQPSCQANPPLQYDSTTHVLKVQTDPATYYPDFLSQYNILPGATLVIKICADNAGNLDTTFPGCAATNTDLVITGDVDVNNNGLPDDGPAYAGVLLTGKIAAFGFRDPSQNTPDFDFRFHVTGGVLAPQFSASDGDVGVVLTAFNATTQVRIDPPVFTHNFVGFEAKGDVSPPADVRIILTPPEATNEVNQQHTITATVEEDDGLPMGDPAGDAYSGYGPAAGASVTFTTSPPGAIVGPSSCTTNASGQCTVTINSSVATTITVNGHTTVIIPGFENTPFERDTDPTTIPPAGFGGSGPAIKHYVDANISITPNDVNGVGDPHTFTIIVNAFPDGAGATTFGPITTSVNPGPTSQSNTCATPVITNGGNTATCTLTINSDVTGVFTANASAQITMGSVTVSRDTDPATATVHGTGGTDSATKRYVDARIKIAPNATNEVGQPHTFTVTVEQDDGLPANAPGGDASTGFGPAPVGNVDVTLTNSNGASFVLNAGASTCDDNQPSGDNLDNNGQCTTTFTSNSAGQVTGHAAVDVVVGGITLHRETNGVAPNSGDAVKTFVDARISITPNGSNPVGASHTFTVHVDKNAGDGSGFVPATVGNVDVTLTNGGGASAVIDTAASTCDDNQPNGDNLDASGNCTLVFTSNTAGTVTGNATVSLVVGGVTVTRATGDSHTGDSGPAVKRFYDFHTNAYTLVSNFTGTAVIDDKATLTGATTSPPAGGTITFTLYNPGGMPIYTDVVTVNCAAASCTYDTAIDGNMPGGYTTLNSDAGGTYYWQVHYSGDANNAPADDNGAPPTGDTNEQVTIIKRQNNGQLSGHKYVVTSSPALSGRMTGGGSIFTTTGDTGDLAYTGSGPTGTNGNRITHGFEIHCDPTNLPNNLEINWHGQTQEDNFHLAVINKATCQESALVQHPPDAPFDTYIGEGVGRLNNSADSDYGIKWTFTDGGPDKGEPGKNDTAKYFIWKDLNHDGMYQVTEPTLLDIGAKQITSIGTPIGPTLMFGNHQAHAENKPSTGIVTGPPIPASGFTIHLFATIGFNGPEDPLGFHDHTVTDNNGFYQFTNLAPGTYAVCEETAPTYTESSPTAGYDCTAHTPLIVTDVMGPVGYAVDVHFDTNRNDLNFTNQQEVHPDGRMTGGGSIFTRSGDIMNNQPAPAGIRITHGFEIHCNPDIDPQRLEINWIPPAITGSKESHFHLLDMLSPTYCRDTAIIQAPPDAPIDTYYGFGTGRFTGTINGTKYQNDQGWRIEFIFTDGGPNTDGSGSYCSQAKGEPGICDTAQYFVYKDANNNGTYESTELVALKSGPTFLDHGNHQAHVEHKKTVTTTKIQNSINGTLDALDQPDLSDSTIVSLTDTLIGQFDQLTAAENNDPPGLAGYVYVDANNNGIFDATEQPLAGVTLSLLRTDITGQGQTNYGSVTTDSTGWYGFGSLPIGSTWKITETQPSTYLDGKDTAGTLGGTVGADTISSIVINGSDGNNYNFGERTPASISGFVYKDFNDDGAKATGDPGLSGVTVNITGTASINGQPVSKTVTTDSSGYYVAGMLEPGTYKITPVQPSGTTNGKETVGTVNGGTNGSSPDGVNYISGILLNSGNAGLNYNFGELSIYQGLMAMIGYWHNAKGQALVKSFGNASNGLSLANTLATNMANLFGKSATAWSVSSTVGTNLTNRTNAEVLSYFLNLYGTNGSSPYAQILGNAFSVFASTNSLNTGSTSRALATADGFKLSNTGAGVATYTVPSADWPAFGLTSTTATQSINNLELLANKYAFKGELNKGVAAQIAQTSEVFTNINNLGNIGFGMTLLAAGATGDIGAGLGQLYAGYYLVSVDGLTGSQGAAEQARITDAIDRLNMTVGQFGVVLAQLPSDIQATADIKLHMADTTKIGGVAAGVLGLTELGGIITFVNGWNWYLDANAGAVGADQYDFDTVVSHELGHALGLGHSTDGQSVMYPFLATGEARRDLSTVDLANLETEETGEPEPLLAIVPPGSTPAANANNFMIGLNLDAEHRLLETGDNSLSTNVAFGYGAILSSVRSGDADQRMLQLSATNSKPIDQLFSQLGKKVSRAPSASLRNEEPEAVDEDQLLSILAADHSTQTGSLVGWKQHPVASNQAERRFASPDALQIALREMRLADTEPSGADENQDGGEQAEETSAE